MINNSKIKVAILQRVCPEYRAALFSDLTMSSDMDVQLFIGEDIPNSKVKSTAHLGNISHKKIKTRFARLGNRILPWHVGLIKELRCFSPDVIVCEAESHFLAYMQAVIYKFLFNRKVGLVYWCYIVLPGETKEKSFIRGRIKSITRRFFNSFVLYSSYGVSKLLEQGYKKEQIFVATNVGDVHKFSNLFKNNTLSKSAARKKVKLPDTFTALYLGALDLNKCPFMLLDLAEQAKVKHDCFNFVLAGSGALLAELREKVKNHQLDNVFLLDRLEKNLADYLSAADVLLIPGRGGIVMSEAMSFGLPVIVHQADGTEYDLIEEGVTGFRLENGARDDFYKALKLLKSQPDRCRRMGESAHALINNSFSTENMIKQIKKAIYFSMRKKD